MIRNLLKQRSPELSSNKKSWARSVERFPNRELVRVSPATRIPFKSNAKSFTTLRLGDLLFYSPQNFFYSVRNILRNYAKVTK